MVPESEPIRIGTGVALAAEILVEHYLVHLH